MTIDGVDISGVTLASLRAQMGLMMQESFVFTGTVMDNLRYGNLAAGDEELIRAAELVCADGFIRALPHGYDTVLTEGGAMLSQGEKQLLALARTMASDPKILILDEATSSVDTKTERELQEGVNRMLKGRTSFIVAHRLSTIRACNKIMYIDHGEIAECGTHEELLARQGPVLAALPGDVTGRPAGAVYSNRRPVSGRRFFASAAFIFPFPKSAPSPARCPGSRPARSRSPPRTRPAVFPRCCPQRSAQAVPG